MHGTVKRGHACIVQTMNRQVWSSGKGIVRPRTSSLGRGRPRSQPSSMGLAVRGHRPRLKHSVSLAAGQRAQLVMRPRVARTAARSCRGMVQRGTGWDAPCWVRLGPLADRGLMQGLAARGGGRGVVHADVSLTV